MTRRREPAERFGQRVRADFDKQRFMTTLGAELRTVAPGEVVIDLPFRAELSQQKGYAHAGVIASIADSACGYAAYTLMPEDSDVLSVEFKVNLLAPSVGERLTARARVVRSGRTITVCQADVYSYEAGSERHVAIMTATMIRVNRS